VADQDLSKECEGGRKDLKSEPDKGKMKKAFFYRKRKDVFIDSGTEAVGRSSLSKKMKKKDRNFRSEME